MRLLAIGTLCFFSILVGSCGKEYTCACTYSQNPEKNFEVILEKMLRNDAKAVCNDWALFVDTTSNYTGGCSLK